MSTRLPEEGDTYLYDEDYDEPSFCNTCNNQGYIIECIDDLCANSNHCIHGDGEVSCPDCDNWM